MIKRNWEDLKVNFVVVYKVFKFFKVICLIKKQREFVCVYVKKLIKQVDFVMVILLYKTIVFLFGYFN